MAKTPKAPSREGKIALTTWVAPELAKLVKVAALMHETTIEKLMTEALQTVLLTYTEGEVITPEKMKAMMGGDPNKHLNALRKRRAEKDK